jgi:SAM-dependent methyltransferase
MRRADVVAAYDARAQEYVDLLGSVDRMAPQDRVTITDWARATPGLLLDAGCGPGHWTEVLAGCGPALGVDASAAFLASACERFPGVPFVLGDLAALPLADDSVGGVLAWFSLIHVPPASLDVLVAELARVLVPGGSLLLGFFDGEPEQAFDHAVTTAYWWSTPALTEILAPHGFTVERSGARQDPGAKRRQGDLTARLAGSGMQSAGWTG